MLIPLRFAALFVAIPLCVPAGPAAQETTKLQWHLATGEVLRYRIRTEQETELSAMPGQGTRMNMAIVLAQTVREIAPDGSAALDVAYEAIRFDSDTGAVALHYDSTHPEAAAGGGDALPAKLFGAMLEAKIQMKLAPSGHISDVTGLKEMLDAALLGLPKDGAPPATMEMFKQLFSEQSIRKMVETNVFPEKALATGDSWQRSMDIPNPIVGTMKFSMDNKFAGIENHAGQPCARIDVRTRMTLAKGGESETASRFVVTMDESEGKGTQWFGLQTGRLVEVSTAMDVDMNFGVPAKDGDPAHALTMEANTSTSMKMVLLAKDEPAFEAEQPKSDAPKK